MPLDTALRTKDKSIVTRITPVFVYRTHYSHTASYRIVWLEYSLSVLAWVSKSLSLEEWTSYLPDTQVQDHDHEGEKSVARSQPDKQRGTTYGHIGFHRHPAGFSPGRPGKQRGSQGSGSASLRLDCRSRFPSAKRQYDQRL